MRLPQPVCKLGPVYYEQQNHSNKLHSAAAAIIHQQRSASTLSLLVLRVLTDNADLTLSLNDLALLAHRLYRRSYFHEKFLLSL